MINLFLEKYPETSLTSDNCVDKKYLFCQEAKDVFECLAQILEASKDQHAIYINNTIGILGGRGSGKTSLMTSVHDTLKKNDYVVPFHDNCYAYPLSSPIDPKVLPDTISIANYILSSLFSEFTYVWYKSLEEAQVNSLYQQFDELNAVLLMLKRINRPDPFENPSDLLDISRIIRVRDLFQNLVDRLLEVCFPKAKNRAFVIAIDDFDLDTLSVYNTSLDINSFLSIRGLAFLLSFDPEIYLREICRQRIRLTSDYGPLSRLNYDPRAQLDKTAITAYKIETDANEFAMHLYAKLIPQSLRVGMGMHSAAQDYTFTTVLDFLCDRLFGFSSQSEPINNNNPHENEIIHMIRGICSTIGQIISDVSDLRMRNQFLNQLITFILESDDKPLFHERMQVKALISMLSTLEGVVEPDKWKNTLSPLLDDLKMFEGGSRKALNLPVTFAAIYEDGNIAIRFYDLFSDYFNKYPCGFYIIESAIKILNITQADYPYKLLALVELTRQESLKIIDDSGEQFVIYRGRKLNLKLFKKPNALINATYVITRINSVLKKSTLLPKYVTYELVNLLQDYNDSLAKEDFFLTKNIRELNNLLNEPWKGENKRAMQEQARRFLHQCVKHLN